MQIDLTVVKGQTELMAKQGLISKIEFGENTGFLLTEDVAKDNVNIYQTLVHMIKSAYPRLFAVGDIIRPTETRVANIEFQLENMIKTGMLASVEDQHYILPDDLKRFKKKPKKWQKEKLKKKIIHILQNIYPYMLSLEDFIRITQTKSSLVKKKLKEMTEQGEIAHVTREESEGYSLPGGITDKNIGRQLWREEKLQRKLLHIIESAYPHSLKVDDLMSITHFDRGIVVRQLDELKHKEILDEIKDGSNTAYALSRDRIGTIINDKKWQEIILREKLFELIKSADPEAVELKDLIRIEHADKAMIIEILENLKKEGHILEKEEVKHKLFYVKGSGVENGNRS